MRKENLVTGKGGEVTGPLTRTRSAAFRACGQRSPLKAPIQQNHKQTLQGNPNSTDLDENNNNAPTNACCKRKRRAVLQDVSNFCCKCSQRNCLNAAKIQAKINKPTRKGQVKVCKVAPSVALEAPLFQAASETKILQETVKIESISKEVISSIDLEEKVSLQLSTIRECDIDDHRLENQSFGMPSQPQFPPKKVTGGLSGDMTILSNLDIIDIDADLKEPRLCSIYAPDIYSNLRVAELARRPCPHFMETIQRDITQSMRGMLVDWLVEVSEGYKLASNTLYLTIYLIDWYLTGNCIERQRLQLLGITCMLLASKYEEGHAPHVEEFCLITGNIYTREEVLELEIQVLKYLGFQLFSPTTKTFLRRFLRAGQASYQTPSIELEYLANYLAESTLIDYGFLNFLPSAIAASAVFLARWTLDQSNDPWNPTLEHYTSYKASDLKIIVLAIQDLQLNTNGCSLHVIRMKYRQQEFKSVAALSSPKLLETLFRR
ncbi:cyclin-A2-4-like [Alnus glutinosa]|uniref:cyclin-A2-4-like n=1 Tax=Alnus glutinosa TaxID=3517 RepID=UPI002D77E6A3|nr:cyclin-A2-4-like [Alnus glutinosa]